MKTYQSAHPWEVVSFVKVALYVTFLLITAANLYHIIYPHEQSTFVYLTIVYGYIAQWIFVLHAHVFINKKHILDALLCVIYLLVVLQAAVTMSTVGTMYVTDFVGIVLNLMLFSLLVHHLFNNSANLDHNSLIAKHCLRVS